MENVFKHGLLHVRLVDTNRAAAQLNTVHDNVIMLAANLLRIRLEHRNVFSHRRGEGMVTGVPPVLFFVEAEKGEINNPKKIKTSSGNGKLAGCFQKLGAVEAELAEDLARRQPLIRGEQDQVTFFNRQFLAESRFFRLAEELDDRRFPFPAFDFDVGQAFGAKFPGQIGHTVCLGLRRASKTFGVNRFHHTVVCNRPTEYFKRATAKFLGEIQ